MGVGYRYIYLYAQSYVAFRIPVTDRIGLLSNESRPDYFLIHILEE